MEYSSPRNRMWSHSRVTSLVRAMARRCGLDIGWRRSRRSLEGFLELVLARYDINVVIDVGANKGQYAKTLRRLGFKGRIVSVEPIPQTFLELSRSFSDDKNWVGYNLALGSRCGEATLMVESQQTDMTSLYRPTTSVPEDFVRWARAEKERIIVRIETLDRLFVACTAGMDEPRVFLKCDTQGHDLEILRGARNSLAKVRALQVEIPVVRIYDGSPSFGEIMDALEEMNFWPCGFYPAAEVRRGGIPVLEFDCIAVEARDWEGPSSNGR